MLYSDEDKIDTDGRRSSPYFKCDWNLDLLRSHNMISHFGVFRTKLIRHVGGFRPGFEGSQDYDLALRCIEHLTPQQIVHVPKVLYHWRVHADSTALDAQAKPYAATAGQRAIEEHLSRCGVQAEVDWIVYGYRVRYAVPTPAPSVTLIIPTRNRGDLLKRCIDSILRATRYPDYDIDIIDNNSDDPATLTYLADLSTHPNIKVTRDPRPFNFSALNNAAVSRARGRFVVLLNDDTEVISADWLEEMVAVAGQPGVGAVGARLWYPDDRIQHAGIVMGMLTLAGHVHRLYPKGAQGYFGRAALRQSISAVTAACLLVDRRLYQEVGGLNEVDLTVAFNDVDFCLRLVEAGYRNVFTPFADLYHHESASRGQDDQPERIERFLPEVAYMLERWPGIIASDPAYSPNLTLEREDCSLAWPPRVDLTT